MTFPVSVETFRPGEVDSCASVIDEKGNNGRHILVDKPSDQKSRWLSDGNKPPQVSVVDGISPEYHSVLCTSMCF